MYPATPNWRSAQALSAWWKSAHGDGTWDINATQGYTFVKTLQQQLNTSPNLRAGWNNPWDVTDLHVGQIEVDGNWGPLTQQALGSVARSLGIARGSQADQVLQGDLASQTISVQTLLIAIWVGFHWNLDITKVQLNSDAVPPVWGQAPPSDGDLSGQTTQWHEGSAAPVVGSNNGQPSVSGGTAITPSPINSPGILGSSAGGLNSGALFLGGMIVVLGITAAAVAGGTSRRRRKRR